MERDMEGSVGIVETVREKVAVGMETACWKAAVGIKMEMETEKKMTQIEKTMAKPEKSMVETKQTIEGTRKTMAVNEKTE
jgi:hypothetical protein